MAAEIERERTARKSAQESLEQYKGECTRLQHKVDRLKGEGAQQSGEIERLTNVISLSEDSRLMDEHIKLERDHERQAERIAELEAQLVIEKGQLDLRDEENRILFTKSEAQSAVINALPEEAEQEVKSN